MQTMLGAGYKKEINVFIDINRRIFTIRDLFDGCRRIS